MERYTDHDTESSLNFLFLETKCKVLISVRKSKCDYKSVFAMISGGKKQVVNYRYSK